MFFPDLKATAEEISQPLPGDVLVKDPGTVIMNAITIAVPPAEVWPWLVQMGSGRGGWYSYDVIDNDGDHSSSVIIPALQNLRPGQVLPSLPDAHDSFDVAVVDPKRDLILTVNSTGGGVGQSWEFFLRPNDGRSTRLLVRGRITADWPSGLGSGETPKSRRRPIELVYVALGKIPRRIMLPIALFRHSLMQARQLRGIKRRAEGG